MNIEVVTPDADGDRGGFGARVHMLLLMLSQFAEVRCLLTSWPRHPKIRNVTFAYAPMTPNPLERIELLRHFYSTRKPPRPDWPRPDVLLVENLDLLAAQRRVRTVPVVLDEHNVYWELLRYDLLNRPFFQSGIGTRQGVQRILYPWLLGRASRFEEDAIRRVDGVLVTSEEDRERILCRIPEASSKVRVVPNCIDVAHHRPTPPEMETASVLFAGNFNYVPNREAGNIITNTLAPDLPMIPFLLVGKDPPKDLTKRPNVVVMGYVDDLSLLLAKAGVCIAPLLHGSGTRIKILTYLAAGKAVVATTKSCEGLEVVNEKHLLIRDDWYAFTAAIQRLLGDPVWRLELGRAGRRFVEENYDWRTQAPKLRRSLEAVTAAG